MSASDPIDRRIQRSRSLLRAAFEHLAEQRDISDITIRDITDQANELYEKLQSSGVTVLFDDRAERPGAKFADAELIGLPYRITISQRLIEQGVLELTYRNTGETELLTLDDLLAKIS